FGNHPLWLSLIIVLLIHAILSSICFKFRSSVQISPSHQPISAYFTQYPVYLPSPTCSMITSTPLCCALTSSMSHFLISRYASPSKVKTPDVPFLICVSPVNPPCSTRWS